MRKFTVYLSDETSDEMDREILNIKAENKSNTGKPGNVGKGEVITRAWEVYKQSQRKKPKG